MSIPVLYTILYTSFIVLTLRIFQKFSFKLSALMFNSGVHVTLQLKEKLDASLS